MVDIVKTALNVSLNRPYWLVWGACRSIYHVYDVTYCVFLRPVWAETVTVRIKFCFTNRLYDNSHTFLYDSVQNCWNTQWALFSILFRDIYPSCGLWSVITETISYQCNQFFSWHLQIFIHFRLVNASRLTAFVRLNVMDCGYYGYFIYHSLYKTCESDSLF